MDIPPACEALMRVLDSRVFSNKLPYDEDDLYNDDYYDDIPDDFQTPHQIVIHHLQEIAEAL